MHSQTVLQRLQRLLAAYECFGPVAEDAISAAEQRLGIVFPPSYRLFLSHFGAATLPYELAGLPDDPAPGETPSWSNAVGDTERAKKAMHGLLPSAYVALSSDGQDHHFYLDTAATDNHGECPVVVLGAGHDGIKVATSFVDFVESIAVKGAWA